MRYAQVSRIGVVLALAATLLHSLPAWAQKTRYPGSTTYRNPNPEGGRVKCSDGGPLKTYLDNIPKRQKALQDELDTLKTSLGTAQKTQRDAQAKLDKAIKGGTWGEKDLAREEVEAAATAVLRIEADIRIKKLELANIPKEKANKLGDISQLCDGLPVFSSCQGVNNNPGGAGVCR